MYNLNKKDIKKYAKEFNKTYYGKMIYLFSILPGIVATVSCFVMLISMLESYLVPTNINELDTTLIYISLVISGSIMSITQLMYLNILEKYIYNSLQTKTKNQKN